MKNLCLVLLFALISTQTLFSQTEKGNWLIGGNAGFDIQFVDNSDDFFTTSLSPNAGLFIQDNFLVGAGLALIYTKIGDINSTSFGLTPFGRIYFPSSGGPSFFFQASAGFVTTRVDNGFNDPNRNTSAIFNGGPGMAFFITDQIAIEGALLYTRVTDDFLASSLGLVFGVQAYLPGKSN